MTTDDNTTQDQQTKPKRCHRCDALLDAVSTERVIGVHRTDNHYIEVCVRCANYLVAATTHRRMQPFVLPDAKI